jgi:hypothetical protein
MLMVKNIEGQNVKRQNTKWDKTSNGINADWDKMLNSKKRQLEKMLNIRNAEWDKTSNRKTLMGQNIERKTHVNIDIFLLLISTVKKYRDYILLHTEGKASLKEVNDTIQIILETKLHN